jgi:hypothetical protein
MNAGDADPGIHFLRRRRREVALTFFYITVKALAMLDDYPTITLRLMVNPEGFFHKRISENLPILG